MNSKKHPKVWIFHTFVSPFSLFFVIAYIDKSRFGQGIKKRYNEAATCPIVSFFIEKRLSELL